MEQSKEEFIKAKERLLTVSFDQARAYSQVVLGIGYVSIFAAWGFTKEYLTHGEILWSALFACVSIIFYVLFEVLTALKISYTVLGLVDAVENPNNFLQKIEEQKKKDKIVNLIYARAWAVCWPLSFILGIASAAILIWAFASHLWSGPSH